MLKDCSNNSVSVMCRERLRSCHVPRQKGEQANEVSGLLITKARSRMTKEPDTHVGLKIYFQGQQCG